MNKLIANKSINKVNFFSIVFAGILFILFISLVFINTYTQYLEDIKNLEKNYLESQKKSIEQETKRALNYIMYKHATSKNKNLKELQAEIVDAIEQMRNPHDGTGYIFIYTFDGINIADPILKKNAGKNLIDFTDPNGKKVIYELIAASKDSNGGFVKYVWNKPTTNTLEEKISYAISYKPWKWMIGSGVYLDNVNKEIEKKKREHSKKISNYMGQTFILTIIVYLIGVFMYRYLMELIKDDIELIRDSSRSLAQINIDSLSFKEFKTVAFHINTMNEKLQDLNKNLEKKVEKRTRELEISERYARKLVVQQDKFVKDAIHEINTPLSIIITNIDLFKLKYSENKYLSKIEAGAKIIHNIYNDLEYSIKKDRINYEPTGINFSKFINERVEFFNEIAIGNNLSFKTDIKDDIKLHINETYLQRICDNTLSNAIKYSFENSKIFVKLYKKDSKISLEISNHGQTIQNPNKLFERFYRENENRGGFGIGLNIIKEICDKNNIKTEVSSEENITVFKYIFESKESQFENITS
jgi:signal transduction histidine kinase